MLNTAGGETVIITGHHFPTSQAELDTLSANVAGLSVNALFISGTSFSFVSPSFIGPDMILEYTINGNTIFKMFNEAPIVTEFTSIQSGYYLLGDTIQFFASNVGAGETV